MVLEKSGAFQPPVECLFDNTNVVWRKLRAICCPQCWETIAPELLNTFKCLLWTVIKDNLIINNYWIKFQLSSIAPEAHSTMVIFSFDLN